MRAGKTAIVTGSTSGIGLGIASGLAGCGTNIVLNGFGAADEIEKIVSDLKRQHNVGVMYSSANIADPDEIEDMVDQARAEFGGVDILVNNAGIQHVDPIEEFPVDKWNAIIAINLSGAFHTCRLTVPDMKKNGWGLPRIEARHAEIDRCSRQRHRAIAVRGVRNIRIEDHYVAGVDPRRPKKLVRAQPWTDQLM